jgi:hypothetical protein
MLKAIRRLFRKPSRLEMAGEIVRLEFTTRVLYLLIRSKTDGGLGFRTVEQILQCKKEDLLKVKRFGPVAYNELQQRLYEHGFIPKPQYLAVKAMKKEQIETPEEAVERRKRNEDFIHFAMGNRPHATSAERIVISTARYTEEHNAPASREMEESG